MKLKYLILSLFFSVYTTSNAQFNLDAVLFAVEDAQKLTENYFESGFNAVAYSITNAWFTSAKSKKFGQFEISIIGNASLISEDQKSFQLNTEDYHLVQFQNGPPVQSVANVLGQNIPDIEAQVVHVLANGNQVSRDFTFPQGLESRGLNFLPTAFPQLSLGFFGGFEFKFRYMPETSIDEGSASFYGIGLQNEISSWIPIIKFLPVSISVASNYTRFFGEINFDDTLIVDTTNGFLENNFTAWTFSGIVSTDLPIINFYAGVTYINSSMEYALKGDYRVSYNDIVSPSIRDPFVSKSTLNGIRKTIGAKLTLAFFRINVDYSIQEFDTISAGISFGI